MKPFDKVNFFALVFVLVLSVPVMGQDDVDDAFDDGIIRSNNIAYIDMASLVAGDLSLSYERRLGDRFALEAGGGVLMPWRIPYFMDLVSGEDDYDLHQSTGGFSWVITAKTIRPYEANPAFEVQRSITLRQRIYNFSDTTTLGFDQVKHTEIAFGYGGRSELGSNFYLQYFTSVGFRFSGVTNKGVEPVTGYLNGISGLAMYLKVQVGYKF